MIKALDIGLKVRALRKNKSLTQKNLAKSIGVSWRTISNLERGVVMPTLPLICDLAQHFEITVDELLKIRIIKNKSAARIRKENLIMEAIYQLDGRQLAHMEEYIKLLKKF